MRKSSKIIALLMACLMILGLFTTAMAASITIDGTGKTYVGYRLLDLTTSLKKDHEAHEGVHDSDCYNYAYTANIKYRGLLIEKLGLESGAKDEDIVKAIEDFKDKADDIRAFADRMYAGLRTMNHDVLADDGSYVVADSNSFDDVKQGYWLIAETETANKQDAISLVMLDTAGQDAIEVKAKEDVPTLTLKVKEVNDTTGAEAWLDAADMDSNDIVEIKMTGTLPNNIEDFPKYEYTFVLETSGDVGATYQDGSVNVKVGENDLADDEFEVTVSGNGIKVTLKDDVVKAGGDIEVTCEFKEDVVRDDKNTPYTQYKAHVEFTASPYEEPSENNTSVTPDDVVRVFFWNLDVSKVDPENEPLAGAGFTLSKKVDGEYKTVKFLDAGENVTGFKFTGLDSGLYKLEETKVPDGYNKAEDIVFEVRGTYDTESADPKVTGLAVYSEDGETSLTGEELMFAVSGQLMSTSVVNSTGIRLPITGGAGVYGIYAVAAGLVIAGCVAIIVRKRKDNLAA